jgi:hypothetical protein
MQKIILRLFSFFGILLFAPLFAVTFLDASLIEKSASGFIEWKIGNDANQKIDAIQIPKSSKLEQLLGDRAKEMLATTDADIEQIKSQLKTELPSILADELAKLRNLDCECRKKWEKKFEAGFLSQLSSLDIQRQRLIEFSRAKYMDIVTQLTRDIRIFLGSNLAVFILLFFISLLKPIATQHLFLPAGLLFISSIICSYFYLFEQNWFFTIIYADYTGYWFSAYLIMVFLFLCDISFNRARVTTEIINILLNSIGKAASNLSPC